MTQHALLFSDLVDSTRLVEKLGDARAAQMWAEHDRRARSLLVSHQGREIDRTDGFFLLFDRVDDAAGFAMAYHRAMADLQLSARVGIHVGAVTLRQNGPQDIARGAKLVEVEGLAKPFAARIMTLAGGGQTLLSVSAQAALGANLPAGAAIESHGHYRLKGVEEPVQVFELGQADRSAFMPPPDAEKVYRVVRDGERWRPLREVRHNLVPERDAFVGRSAELRLLAQSLDAGARLLTVVGPGGTGKTRFVRRYALAWLGDWPGGVYFCDLSEARSLDGIHFAVAFALGVPLGKDDPAVQLGHAIAGRGRCLVVLDNFEQVVAHAPATLARWLDRADGAAFVVTSRQRLHLPGELILPMEPLPLQTEAIELFVARAKAQRPDFALADDNQAEVAEVVRLLDGLPLAIELAAARVRVLSPAQIVERLKDRFRLLAGAHGAAARQATLRAAIDWSWDLLTPWEQAALAQCSVFEGGFTLDAAEAVLDLSAWPEAPPAMDAVQALVDKSLLRVWMPKRQGRMDIAEPYFGMYLSIHEYAAGKLQHSRGDATRLAHERHGKYFSDFGSDEAIAALASHGGVQRRHMLALEIDNLVAACHRAILRGDRDAALGTYRATWQVLELRGPFALGVALGDQLLALDGITAAQRTKGLMTLASALSRVGRVGDARSCLTEALGGATQLGDQGNVGAVQRNLGLLLHEQGHLAEARSHYETALAISQAQGDRHGMSSVLGNRGNLYCDEGRMDQARAHYEQSLAIRRELGDRRAEGTILGNLATLLNEQGHLAEADTCYHAALAIHREVGDHRGEGIALGNLGAVRHDQGQEEQAEQYIRQALAIHRDLGNRRLEGIALGSLGVVLYWQERLDEARSLLEQSLVIHRQVGNRTFEGIVLCNLAAVLGDQGRADEAQRHLRDGLRAAREAGNRRFEGAILGSLAECLFTQGQLAETGDLLRAGEEHLREVGDRLELSKLLCVRGRVECFTGDADAARLTLAEAESLTQATGANPGSELGRALARLRAAVG